VGTLDGFYQANMDLLKPSPPLDLYQEDWPIRTYQIQGPPARTVPGKLGSEGIFINSIVAGGVVISGGTVKQSILFPGVYVGDVDVWESDRFLNLAYPEEMFKTEAGTFKRQGTGSGPSPFSRQQRRSDVTMWSTLPSWAIRSR